MRHLAFALVLSTVVVLAGASRAAETITWDDAEKHVGQEVVVDGRVMGIHCSPTSCLLAFDPTFNRFTAVVQAESFKVLPPDVLDSTYVGRKVHVHGTITVIDKKPEIVVASPADIEVVVTKEERAKAQSDAQEAVVDRLDTLIDRIETLTERFVDAQQRLEELAASLDQRAAELAALQQTPAPPPPAAPSYGEPQPRPGYEALRSIKQGMTSDQVARLVGEPLDVQTAGNGVAIWDYGGGRTITFDQRGRASSMVGFPAP
jgi:hypothetical protein